MAEQEPVFIDPFASEPSTPERVFIDPFEVVEDPDAVPTILEIAEEEPDAISTQMYSGLNFLEAREKYESIIEGDDVTKPLLGFLG